MATFFYCIVIWFQNPTVARAIAEKFVGTSTCISVHFHLNLEIYFHNNNIFRVVNTGKCALSLQMPQTLEQPELTSIVQTKIESFLQQLSLFGRFVASSPINICIRILYV